MKKGNLDLKLYEIVFSINSFLSVFSLSKLFTLLEMKKEEDVKISAYLSIFIGILCKYNAIKLCKKITY